MDGVGRSSLEEGTKVIDVSDDAIAKCQRFNERKIQACRFIRLKPKVRPLRGDDVCGGDAGQKFEQIIERRTDASRKP